MELRTGYVELLPVHGVSGMPLTGSLTHSPHGLLGTGYRNWAWHYCLQLGHPTGYIQPGMGYKQLVGTKNLLLTDYSFMH